MLTARPCDALSSFAGPGSSVRSCRLFPRSARFRRIASQRWEKTTAVAVKIKLKRLGKIREPYYRIVVADARTKRDGRAIEEIGKYHPKAEPSFIEVNSERVQHWLSVGAQPTDPVRVLLKITGDWPKVTGEPGAEGTRGAEPDVLEEALEHLVRGIVQYPDDVQVASRSLRRGSVLEVRVHPDDLGKVIGRGGRTARALRTVIGALAAGRYVRIDLLDANEIR